MHLHLARAFAFAYALAPVLARGEMLGASSAELVGLVVRRLGRRERFIFATFSRTAV